MGVYKVLIIATALAQAAACSSATEPAPKAAAPLTADHSIVRVDPALDAVIASDANVEKIASGFKFLEGPLWRATTAGRSTSRP